VNFLPGSSHAVGDGSTNPTAEHNFAFAVFATNNVTGAPNADTTLLANLNPAPLAGTDVLIAHTATDLGIQVLAAPAPSATQFTVRNRGLTTASILSVADCSGNFIFQPTAASVGVTQTITHPMRTWPVPPPPVPPPVPPLQPPPNPPVDSTVMLLNAPIYYIANNAAGTPSLYRRLIGGNSEELLNGVQDMQIEVGIDTNNDGIVDVFSTPNAVTANQWNAWNDSNGDGDIQELLDGDGAPVNPAVRAEQNVVAVRYSLLLRSDETNLVETPQPYTFNGVTTTPTDRRMRQVVTSTVGIRSRLNNSN
jgi:type IV pilus assembly protein PilW